MHIQNEKAHTLYMHYTCIVYCIAHSKKELEGFFPLVYKPRACVHIQQI